MTSSTFLQYFRLGGGRDTIIMKVNVNTPVVC